MIRAGRLVAVAFVLSSSAALLITAPAGATTSLASINGQGSTYAALAFQTWTQGAQVRGLNVNYTATGSPAGLAGYNADTATFAGTEAEYSEMYPTTPNPTGRVPRGYAYAPDLGSAAALMYHVAANPTGSDPVTDLRLSPLTAARIFLGVIKWWTSPTIAADNPTLTLPHEPITLVLRSGQSGTTALFYDWVKHSDPTQYATWVSANHFPTSSRVWQVTNGTSFGRGTGDDFLDGPDLQAETIASKTGLWSIGYDEFGYANIYDDEVASVENASGNWVQPTAKRITDALKSATLAPDTSETLAGVYGSTTPSAYPASFYSYLLYQCTSSPTRPSCKGTYANPAVTNTMAKFMRYVACTGQIELAQIGYAPLPPNLSQDLADAIGYMTGQAPEQLTAENCASPEFHDGSLTASVTPSVRPSGVVAGSEVTYSAIVTSDRGTPTGSVTFTSGSTTLCEASLSAGTGSCTATNAPPGADTVTAAYDGDSTFAPGSATTSLDVAPSPPPAPTGATGSQSSTSTSPTDTALVEVGTLTADGDGLGSLTVATYGGNPTTGAVRRGSGAFYDVAVGSGSQFTSLDLSICGIGQGNSAVWWNGTAWVPFSDQAPTVGCVRVTVSDATSPGLSQLAGTPLTVVDTTRVVPTLSASVAPPTSVAGQPVDLTAVLASPAGQPTGTVTFTSGSVGLCTATLSGGRGSCSTSVVPVGTDPLTAAYSGDSTFTGVTGAATLVVVPAPAPAPAGSAAADSATSTSPTGTASAQAGGVSGTATGLGSLTVGTYGGNPTSGAVTGGTGAFYDVGVAPGSTFTSLTTTFCDLGGGNSVSWWNGTTWQPFSDQAYSSATQCVTATVDGSTSPTLAQLTGTPVAATDTLPPTDGSLAGPVVGMASLPNGSGYWLVNAAGAVSAHGRAANYGSMAGQPLNAPITHIVATADGKGYWLVAADGGTFAFGDAGFYGSMGGQHLNAPVVDIAPTADGQGYWLVASDGGIFAFGDAQFHGSMGGQPLNQPVVAIGADDATGGYWLVASDGGIFAFGSPFYGSTGGTPLNRPVNGMASTPDGGGYWLVASDGGIFAFGDAQFHGSTGGMALNGPIVSMAPDSVSGGYWLVGSDGGIFAYGAPFFGAD